jgi:hypothetical protein
MMDELTYNLQLQSTSGFNLLGTLRFRFRSGELEGVKNAGDLPALLARTLERPTVELDTVPTEGSISIQFLTGARPVPISGFSVFTFIAPLTTLFSSTDPARNLSLQFGLVDNTRIAGGLIWQPNTPRQAVFSLLGTPRLVGLEAEEHGWQQAEEAQAQP